MNVLRDPILGFKLWIQNGPREPRLDVYVLSTYDHESYYDSLDMDHINVEKI